MGILCNLFRAIGIVVGLVFVAAGLFSIFGLMPESDGIQRSWSERLVSSLPAMVYGILLLLPQSLFLRGKRHVFLVVCYMSLIVAALPFTILGVFEYYEGGKHWLIIPTSLALLAVPTSNALVLWYAGRRAQTTPNKSSSPDLPRRSAELRR